MTKKKSQENVVETPDEAFQQPSAPSPESGADKEVKPTIESRFRKHLAKRKDLRVFYDKATEARMVMEWVDGRWVRLTAASRQAFAEDYVSSFESLYKSQTVGSCASLIGSALWNMDQKLELLDFGKHYVSTKHMLVEITKEGVVVLPHDRSKYIPLYTPLELDAKRIQTDPDPRKSGKDLKKFYKLRPETVLMNSYFGRLLNDLFPDEKTLEIFQEFFGSFFLSDSGQVFPVLSGGAGRGKSVLLKVICGMLDRSQVINFSKLTSAQLAKLHLAPVIGADEMRGKVDVTLFKQVTGRSPIMADHKYEDPFTFEVIAKIIFAWNNPPRFDDHSEAIEQRLAIFTVGGEAKRGMKNEIKGLDRIILRDELDIVFEWAMHGALRVLKRGRMPSKSDFTERMLEDKDKMARQSDPFLGFVEDYGIRPLDSPDGTVYLKDDVYKLVKEWLQDEGRHAGMTMVKETAMKHFRRVMEQKYGVGCIGGEMKKTVTLANGKKKRIHVLPVQIDMECSIKPLVETASGWIHNPDAPEVLRREKKRVEDEKARRETLGQERYTEEESIKMIANGFVEKVDEKTGEKYWVKVEKGVKIEDDPIKELLN